MPKKEDPAELLLMKNWRPITIGNHLFRFFTRFLAKRLASACQLSPRRRGFIPAPGCSENVYVLSNLLTQAKRAKKDLSVVFIDMSKAFDSIPHKALVAALRRFGIDERLVDLVLELYREGKTSFPWEESSTRDISMKIGVKQGDPLSPLLFNLALDPFLQKVDSLNVGYRLSNGERISALAFADDTGVVSESWESMQVVLQATSAFCASSGLKINVAKCAGMWIKAKGKAWTVNDCEPWKISG